MVLYSGAIGVSQHERWSRVGWLGGTVDAKREGVIGLLWNFQVRSC